MYHQTFKSLESNVNRLLKSQKRSDYNLRPKLAEYAEVIKHESYLLEIDIHKYFTEWESADDIPMRLGYIGLWLIYVRKSLNNVSVESISRQLENKPVYFNSSHSSPNSNPNPINTYFLKQTVEELIQLSENLCSLINYSNFRDTAADMEVCIAEMTYRLCVVAEYFQLDLKDCVQKAIATR